MRRLGILGFAILAACKSLDSEVQIPTIQIPNGYVVYNFEPSILNYTYVDTTFGTDLKMHWLTGVPFRGTNCLALSPRTGGDTTGQFVFTHVDANIGTIERLNHGQIDSTVGFFLQGSEGTHGNYAVTAAGALNLSWADGSLAPGGGGNGNGRFFAPQSVIRLHGDTISSDTDFKLNGDSIHIDWNVRWLLGPCVS